MLYFKSMSIERVAPLTHNGLSIIAGLSKRLTRLARMAPRSQVFADIGADHALLPIALILCGKCQNAIACDISQSALEKARANARKYGVELNARKGDGLSVLKPGEAGLIGVCGMGGKLMADILYAGRGRLKGAALLLSPNNAERQVRECLGRIGYKIEDEDIVYENRRYYQLILAKPGAALPLGQGELEFGPLNLEKRPAELAPLIEKRMRDAVKMRDTARKGQGERARRAQEAAVSRVKLYEELMKCR